MFLGVPILHWIIAALIVVFVWCICLIIFNAIKGYVERKSCKLDEDDVEITWW